MLDYRKLIMTELASMTDAQAADFNETVMRANLAHIEWFDGSADTDTLVEMLGSILGQLNIDKIEQRDVRAHLDAGSKKKFEAFEERADDMGIAIMDDEPIKEAVPPSERALYMRMIRSIMSIDAEGARMFADARMTVKLDVIRSIGTIKPYEGREYHLSVLFNYIAGDRGYVVGVDADVLRLYSGLAPCFEKVSDILTELMDNVTGDDFHPDILEQLKNVPVKPSVRERLRKFLGK